MTPSDQHFIPLTRPSLPDINNVLENLRESYASGTVTNGRLVKLFEEEVCRFTGARHAVAVSSCTSGLILALASKRFPAHSEVIVPSFTFAATVEAIVWNDLTPVYVDCLPETMTIDPGEVVRALGPDTAAVCPVNVFGLPPDVTSLTEISERYGLPLIFDSAQGLGSSFEGKASGCFGLCEAFSLSPSKVITAIEGGLITTDDTVTAERVKCMRDYGKSPDGDDMLFNGLSARMSELHACVGLLNLRRADALISSRVRLIRRYAERLANMPGCKTQQLPGDRTTSGNYFTLLVGEAASLPRDRLYEELKARSIYTKKYYAMPVHAQTAFRDRPHRIVGDLRHTWAATTESLALPLYGHLTDQEQDRVCDAIESLLGGR